MPVGVVPLLALIGKLAEGKFLLEFASKLETVADELLARLDQRLLGRDGAVSLDAE
jgi:hypothetical protein